MAKKERFKTKYVGIFYRVVNRIGGKGDEKVFYAMYRKDGKLVEAKLGRQYADNMTESKASLLRAELIEGKRLTRKEEREQVEAEKQADESRWTFDKLWEEYKRQKTIYKGKGPDENRYVNYLKTPFGEREPKELLPLDVDRVRLQMLKKGKSPQTVKLTLALLRRLSNFGLKKRLCEGVPFIIEMPKVNNIKTEDLNSEQLDALLKAIDEDDCVPAKNIMRMVLFTGMRRGEMFRLKWSDIDFEKGFILLRDPKGGLNQQIPLNDAARELLKKHPREGSPFVFPGRNGGQRVDIHHQVNRIRDNAGLPSDFRALHGLRHVYASMLASSGKVDLYTLQRLLTHKSPSMTMRYAHLRDSALRDASNLAGDIVNGAMCKTEKERKEKKVVNLKR